MAEELTAPEVPTFTIPAENMAGLREKLAKLAKRAVKLGVEPPVLTVLETIEYPEVWYPDHGDLLVIGSHRGVETGRILTKYVVTVTGEAPRFAGWVLTAVIELDHEAEAAGRDAGIEVPHVVHVVEGEADPAWRLMPERCDHCHVDNRRRNKLVVVTHENGDQAIVGTTCLRDFLGHQAPATVAAWAQYVEDLAEVTDFDPDTFTGGGEERWDPVTYLAWVVRAITEFGWVTRGAARYDGTVTATADRAVQLALLATGRITPSRNEVRPDMVTDAEKAKATEALAWAAQINPGNEYLANLQAVALKPLWRSDDLGLAASILPGFDRELERTVVRKLAADQFADSVHFGKVKERLDIDGTVTFTKAFENDWGVTVLVKILTADGNVVVWWCSNPNNAPEIGEHVTGKATVKAHDTYEGIAQTVITRAKFAKAAPTAEEQIGVAAADDCPAHRAPWLNPV